MAIDYSSADELAAIFRDEVGPALAETFHADTYQIVSLEWVSDGSGGRTQQEVAGESGRCELQTFSPRTGGERVVGAIPTIDKPYVLEMPRDTAISTNDVVYVNGRKFEVSNVVHPGKADMFTYAAIDEVTA